MTATEEEAVERMVALPVHPLHRLQQDHRRSVSGAKQYLRAASVYEVKLRIVHSRTLRKKLRKCLKFDVIYADFSLAE